MAICGAAQVLRFSDVDSPAAAYDTSDVEFVRLSSTAFIAELAQLDLGGLCVRAARCGGVSARLHP